MQKFESKNHYKWVFTNNEGDEVSEDIATKAIEMIAIPDGEDCIDIIESDITLEKVDGEWVIDNI